MNKNINKIIAIGIGLSIMSGNVIPVFAKEGRSINATVQTLSDDSNNGQTTNEKKVLHLQDAIDAAIKNSDKLELKSRELFLYRDKMDLQERIDEFYDSIDQNVYDFPYDKLELQEEQTKQSREFLEDQIANDITNKFNAIVLKEIDIEKSKRNLEIKLKDFNTMKTKVEIGMATPNQLTDSKIEIKTLKDNIKAKEDSLKNSKDYFEVLTDLDLEEYTLDRDIDYYVFRIDGSIDEYLSKRIDEYLKYNDEMLSLTKDYLEDLEDDDMDDIPEKPDIEKPDAKDYVIVDKVEIDATTGKPKIDLETGKPKVKLVTNILGKTVLDGAYAAKLLEYQKAQQEYYKKLNIYGAYLDGRYGVHEAEVKLDEARKNLKNGLKECYATLLDLENKISTLEEQVKSTDTKLNFAKTQLDVGMMTKNEYEDAVLKSKDLDIGLRKLKNTYNTLKETIQKPWILNPENK